MMFMVRKAIVDDMEKYFEWVNDKNVRVNSFQSNQISLNNHIHWFNRKLNDADSYLYVIEKSNIMLGQVRFDVLGKEATIDYSIDQEYRGLGLSKDLIKLAIFQFKMDSRNINKIIAKVKISNLVSESVLISSRFKLEDNNTDDVFKTYIYSL